MDETGIDTYLYREYGYAPRGKAVIGKIPGRKFQRTNIVAAKLGTHIVAPMQYHGITDSTLFEFWFEQLPFAMPSGRYSDCNGQRLISS